MRMLKHFQPHSFLCHLWCILFMWIVRLTYIYIWNSYHDHFKKKFTKQLRQTSFFFLSSWHTIYFTLLINCINTTVLPPRTITSSQHHPRESRSFLGQPNLYKKTYIAFAYYDFALYIYSHIQYENEAKFLLVFFHLLYSHIQYENEAKFLLVFFHLLYSHIQYENEAKFLLVFFHLLYSHIQYDFFFVIRWYFLFSLFYFYCIENWMSLLSPSFVFSFYLILSMETVFLFWIFIYLRILCMHFINFFFLFFWKKNTILRDYYILF